MSESEFESLGKEERISALKKDVERKENARNRFYAMNVQVFISDEEKQRFFEETDGFISGIVESPTFVHCYLSEGSIRSVNVRTNTYRYADIDGAIDAVRKMALTCNYFYDLFKTRDEDGNEWINLRIGSAEDGGKMRQHKREQRIDEILQTISKPR